MQHSEPRTDCRVGLSEFGYRLSTSFHLKEAPTLVTRSLARTEIAVTDCYSDSPDHEVSSGLPDDDAYIVGLQLRDYAACETWEEQRVVARTDVRAGETHLYHLKRDPRFFMDKPFHMLAFYIPRAVFDTIVDEERAARIDELNYRPGFGWDDDVVRGLGRAMLGALARPEHASRLFVDHVTLAVAAHVAQTYGRMAPVRRPPNGGLAGWQQKRACALLDSHLDGGMALRDIAAECGLSVSRSSRAFRETMGVAPHGWLLRQRIKVAKSLLHDRRRSLSDVARAAAPVAGDSSCSFGLSSPLQQMASRPVADGRDSVERLKLINLRDVPCDRHWVTRYLSPSVVAIF